MLRYPTDLVRQIRVGRHPNSTVRVVLDMEGVEPHSVYTLYNPFRLVIDCDTIDARRREAPPASRRRPEADRNEVARTCRGPAAASTPRFKVPGDGP